ncbi:hypothetical protein RHSIM_Rhsim04G0077100 [Rhododendron simsii]|uniref:Uncharacterized protein n=1 Tax=Rhododendron simsii TaxID=118357 RepID=A0A834H3C3_RHOSS|nr:hypothetical protein RHSIM_Rhsim04G0077100 [Rhododendron simsii]
MHSGPGLLAQPEVDPSPNHIDLGLASKSQHPMVRELGRVSSYDNCGYAFIGDQDSFNFSSLSDFLDPTFVHRAAVVLDFAIGNQNCAVANNSNAYLCNPNNTLCIDNTESGLGGYLCSCEYGYKGNPYLSPGCTDIDECKDPNLNDCDGNATCTNTPGSFNCSCNPHYFGDGRSDGSGCTPDQASQISVIKLSLVGTFSSLGAVLLLICMWWLYREVNRRKEAKLKEKFFKRNGGLLLQQQLSSDQGNLETTKLFTSKELKKATDNYNANRILGQGGQGTVYKGMLADGRIVAIKKSKALAEGKHEQFINEVVILSRINIRNVVKLFGCCLETEVPMLVYEFIPNGTLFQCLHEQNEEFPLTWDLRLRIATDIAGALFYLHSLASIAVYHRDIKSANILLDEKFRAKVSDFGISRSISVDNTHLTTAVQGTFGYLDPKYFQSSQFTEKSDVYSFGVVLVELLTGKKPILSGKSNEGGSLTAYFLLTMQENRLYDILDARVVKEGGEKEILAVANIAKRCLYLNGSSRPTMKEVVMELDGIRISNGATATGNQSCDIVEYVTEDDLTGPQEAASTSTGSSYHAMNIELPLLLDKSSRPLLLDKSSSSLCIVMLCVCLNCSSTRPLDHFITIVLLVMDANQVIGRGGYGVVYKGILPDQRVVAIKKSKVMDANQVEQFINELLIVTQVNHRNVAKLLGSVEAASSLSCLHSAASIPIIHRDVKSANILLDANYVAKMADFGASRLVPLDQTQVTTLVQGTLGYLDPKYFHTSQLNEKSDVYSFGVVLAELLTGKKPICLERSQKEMNLATYFLVSMKENRLYQILEPRVMKEGTLDQLQAIGELVKMRLCVKSEERPAMKEVVMELESLGKYKKDPWVNQLSHEESESLLSDKAPTDIYTFSIGPTGDILGQYSFGSSTTFSFSKSFN